MRIQHAIDELVESGVERGVQVAVHRDGVLVVDAVAGMADPATGRRVGSSTPFYNFSIGKGATAAVVHVLVERGLFGYETRVVEVWPEFGAHGKDTVTVRHVLTHSAGVPEVPSGTTPEDLCDWDRMCATVADARLSWEPGTKIGYHAWTFGYILGEIVRRATGRPISQVLRDEVAGPLGVTDELYLGVPEPEQGRLARLEDAEDTHAATLAPSAELGNRGDILAANIPATAATSARAMARVYAALLGEVDGVRLISPERLGQVTAIAASGRDELFGNPSVWGLGYAIGLPGAAPGQPSTAFGMGGAGGSYAFGDTATGIAFALTKNCMTNDFETVTRISRLVTGTAVVG